MARRDREPTALGDLLKTVVVGRGWQERMALGRLRDAWPDVVGAQVAAHSEPVRLVNRALIVRADPGAWATELTLLSRTLVSKAETYLGVGSVTEVRIAAAPPQARTEP